MIRVLIVDDSKLVHEGLQAMFASDDNIDVCGFAYNGKEAIKQISNNKPNVVLVDVLMPVMNGIETTKEISKLFPEVEVIVLSDFEDDLVILKAIAAGAKGYLFKNVMARDLVSAVRAVDRGFARFAPGIVDCLAENILKNSKLAVPPSYPICRSEITKITEAKSELREPFLQCGDWLSIILIAIILHQTIGMSLYLAHLGLFFLMLSLIARPICSWWDWLFKHRRLIGISAFVLSVVHTTHMLDHALSWNLDAMAFMLPQHRLGISAGILSLLLLFPAAITSSGFCQQKLGNKWRQIHLLTVPALILAVLHIILIGSHYMGTFEIETVNYARTLGLITAGSLILLIRRKFFWFILNLNNTSVR